MVWEGLGGGARGAGRDAGLAGANEGTAVDHRAVSGIKVQGRSHLWESGSLLSGHRFTKIGLGRPEIGESVMSLRETVRSREAKFGTSVIKLPHRFRFYRLFR